MAWKSWDVYVVKDGETVHRGVTGGVSRQSARELASTLFNIAKDKLMLVPKGSAGQKKRAATGFAVTDEGLWAQYLTMAGGKEIK